MDCDVIIVGAGVSGLMSALELSEAGVRCCLVDRGSPGKESSWAGGGILSPLYPWNYPGAVNQLAQWSTRYYPDFFSRLQQQTEINPEWIQSGQLILDEKLPSETIDSWAHTYRTTIKSVDRDEIEQLEPGIASQFEQAFWLPDIGQVRNPRLMQALISRANQLHIPIYEHTEVQKFLIANNQITGIQTSDSRLSAENVLVTAGAWSGTGFTADNTIISLPPVKPIKGQMIQFQTEPGTIQRINLYQDHYVIPRKDGKVLAGSTLENTGFDKSTDKTAARHLKQVAIQLFPALESAPIINHWAGLRPGNERQTPFIGEHPNIDKLFFNTGHFRNGIILGLASARLITDLILKRKPILDPTDYALA